MLLYLLLAVLGLLCLHAYIRYGTYRKAINKLPGPTPFPVIGNILLFNKSQEKIWTYLHRLMRIYDPILKIWIGNIAMVFIQDPDDLKVLLSDKINIVKGQMYKPLDMCIKSGLIMSKSELWQKRRKMITPAFHAAVIKRCAEITFEQGERFIQSIKAQGDESFQSLTPLCPELTLNIIIEAVMGVQLKTIGDKADEYKQAVDYFLSSVAYRAFRPYIKDWMLKFHSEGRKILASAKTGRDFADKIIEERRNYQDQMKWQSFENSVNDIDQFDFNEEGCKNRLAMLDLLLLAEKENLIDDRGISDEVNTVITAGYETTGMAMVYVLMLLAENREAQELARQEAGRVLSASGNKITLMDVQKMEFIERCVKEALRLFPTVPYIGRSLIENVQLKNGTIPAGTEVFIPIFSVHRNPKLWSDPLTFNPDRHLPEEVLNRHPFAYLPFSHGPRNCIGQKVAMLELKTLTAQILHNFYLEPVDHTEDLPFKLDAVLLPTIKPKIKFIKIKK